MKKICILLLLLFFPFMALSQVEGVNYQWQKTVDKAGIQVFSSPIEGSKFRAVRSQMKIKTQVSSLVALLEDTENCSNWASLCKEVSLVKEVTKQEYFIYILNAVIFPISDRDLIAHVSWVKDPSTGKVTMNSRAVEYSQGVPKRKGVVRLDYALTQWSFTPQADGFVLVESYAHIDPNGSIPAWIVNRMSRTAPFRSMQKIRNIMQTDVYTNKAINLPLESL